MARTKLMAGLNADPTLGEICKILLGVTGLEDDYLDKNVLKTDSRLRAYGVNSLSVIALSAGLRKSFEAQIPMKALLDPSLNITGLRDLVQKTLLNRNGRESSMPRDDSYSGRKVLEDFQQLKSRLLEPGEPLRTEPTRGCARRVLLTGAIGYVGSHILRSLLACPYMSKVNVLVRAPTQKLALARTIGATKTGKWWNESLLTKLELRLGDLSQPNLRLSAEYLSRLGSYTSMNVAVDSIVHNGAVVH